jgi:hypothetical protein
MPIELDELSAEQAAILSLLGRIEALEREAASLRRGLSLLDQPMGSVGAGLGMGVRRGVELQLARVRS